MNKSISSKTVYVMSASLLAFCSAFVLMFEQPVHATNGTVVVSDDKTAVIPVIYGIVCLASLILVAASCLIHKRDLKLILLSIFVFLCNAGYFFMSISRTLEGALMGNRVAYLGSVFLILFMLLIIMEVSGVKPVKSVQVLLLCISAVVFSITATGGITDIYYKDVELVIINGTAKLVKEYGPMHSVYYVYVFVFFLAMICVILYSVLKKKAGAGKYAAFFATAVLGNIGIWFSEQFLSENFEFLSISYVLTEMLLLFMHSIMNDRNEFIRKKVCESVSSHTDSPVMESLTSREREVAALLLQDKKRREIAEELGITEHTVKKHTSNILSKLGVGSRKELISLFKEENK